MRLSGGEDALIGKAACLAFDVNSGWSASVIEDKKQATDLIGRAFSNGSGSATAHLVKGNILVSGHPEEALAEYDTAIEIKPNFHPAYSAKGIALILSGRAHEAFSPLELALRISPRDAFAFSWHWGLCHAHLHLHEYKEAIEECRRSMNMKTRTCRLT